MHAISRYRVNRLTNKQRPSARPPVANTQTGPITIHCAAKLSAQCNELLLALSAANVGCYVGDNFVDALAYADDVVLTASSATVLRKMLAICM